MQKHVILSKSYVVLILKIFQTFFFSNFLISLNNFTIKFYPTSIKDLALSPV